MGELGTGVDASQVSRSPAATQSAQYFKRSGKGKGSATLPNGGLSDRRSLSFRSEAETFIEEIFASLQQPHIESQKIRLGLPTLQEQEDCQLPCKVLVMEALKGQEYRIWMLQKGEIRPSNRC